MPFSGVTRVYRPDDDEAHLLGPQDGESTAHALCRAKPPAADGWRGTGNPVEAGQAAALPLCAACRRLADWAAGAWWLPSAHARRAFLPEDPQEHSRQVCDLVAAFWPSGAAVEVPLGTAATVALLPLADSQAPVLARTIAELPPGGLIELMRATWAELWVRHPYLTECAGLLYRWLGTASDETAQQVTELTHLLLRAGLVEHGADPRRYLKADLLGRLLQQLTARGEKGRRGAFHTPDFVCDFMSEILSGLSEGESTGELAAGSGAMWRAAAAQLRWEGKDPAEFPWVGVEIDPLAAATLAANSLLWRLGDDVLIACADGLSRDSGLGRAHEHRTQATARRNAFVESPSQ
ncbi:N-6 DNA methylase [Streptomyces aureoversilis]|uniref:N-6 DNA methylase n=1 Tax=Streptomyces aureoversilis TaxID=67277 RepID=A0ABW0AAB8_9ACTN